MKKRRKNNKGFSLVELIIVIAIMAILVAILAPQFLKYVERSRNTADVANAREITNAIIAYIADSEVEEGIDAGGATVTVQSTGTAITGDSNATVLHALTEAGITTRTNAADLTDIKCKSKTSWTAYTVTVGVDTNGVITFTYKATGGSSEAAEAAFANAFQQGSGGSSSGTTTSDNSGT